MDLRDSSDMFEAPCTTQSIGPLYFLQEAAEEHCDWNGRQSWSVGPGAPGCRTCPSAVSGALFGHEL